MLITVRAPRYSSNARRLRRQLGSGSDADSVTHSPIGVRVRYKTWRSRKDTHLHVLFAEGSEAFESLPVAVRNLGPWTGGPEGDVDRLRLPYRILSQRAEVRGDPRPRVRAAVGDRESSRAAERRLSGVQGRGATAWRAEAEDLSPMQ